MIRNIKQTLASLILVPAVLAVNAHATENLNYYTYDNIDSFTEVIIPLFSKKDTECLAKNIYYESGREPEEGKVAVGLVTINRFNDYRYPKTICGVVYHRTNNGQKTICQFNWTCTKSKHNRPKDTDPAWQESLRIAVALAYGGYPEWREKYRKSFHFHAVYVNPQWKLKRIGQVGGHVFYQ